MDKNVIHKISVMTRMIGSVTCFSLILCSCTKDVGKKAVVKTLTFCDTQAVTYNSQVKNILDLNCAVTGCHAGSNPSGILLDSYSTARFEFESGKGFCSINFSDGCNPMPYPIGSPKLSDSLIRILTCWKDKGFLN